MKDWIKFSPLSFLISIVIIAIITTAIKNQYPAIELSYLFPLLIVLLLILTFIFDKLITKNAPKETIKKEDK